VAGATGLAEAIEDVVGVAEATGLVEAVGVEDTLAGSGLAEQATVINKTATTTTRRMNHQRRMQSAGFAAGDFDR